MLRVLGFVIDELGNIVGVAVSKLNAQKIFKEDGIIPENTNFGVKATAVRNLMEANKVPFKSPNNSSISKETLSNSATEGTVFLSCWMTMAQYEQMKSKKVMFESLE